jgi:hypothetical protein
MLLVQPATVRQHTLSVIGGDVKLESAVMC